MSKEPTYGRGLLLGVVAGAGLVNGIHTLVVNQFQEDDKREQIAEIQDYNKDIEAELQNDFTSIEGLRLTIEGREFSFETRPETRTPEMCEGRYEITQETAKVAGGVACTRGIVVGEGN